MGSVRIIKHAYFHIFKLKSQILESSEAIESLRRENGNLASVIKDLMDQLDDSNKTVHDLEKTNRKLELEGEESRSCLKDMTAMLDSNKTEMQAANGELSQLRQKIDRVLSDKEEEFDELR